MRFVHLTDLHVIAAERGALYGIDPVARLQAAISDINLRHGPGSAAQAAFVLITGDLVHDGTESDYQTLREALRMLALPLWMTLGNHDDRPRFRSTFPGHPVDPSGYVQFALSAGSSRVLVLDTHVPGCPHGELSPPQLAWLSERLAEDQAPVLLALHHPPVAIGLGLLDRIRLRQEDELWQVLAPHRTRIRHLLFGHTHRLMAGSWRGIPFSNGNAMGHQVALDFALQDGVRGSREPPTYAVVQLDESDVVVHFHNFLDRTADFLL